MSRGWESRCTKKNSERCRRILLCRRVRPDVERERPFTTIRLTSRSGHKTIIPLLVAEVPTARDRERNALAASWESIRVDWRLRVAGESVPESPSVPPGQCESHAPRLGDSGRKFPVPMFLPSDSLILRKFQATHTHRTTSDFAESVLATVGGRLRPQRRLRIVRWRI